jgi:phosphogluconate dehydratase
MIRLDAEAGVLDVLVDAAEFAVRPPAVADLGHERRGAGRELFAGFRRLVGAAEEGASSLALGSEP